MHLNAANMQKPPTKEGSLVLHYSMIQNMPEIHDSIIFVHQI